MTAPLALPRARPLEWARDVRVRRALLEAVTVGVVMALAIYIAARAQAAGGLDVAFMQDRAGFGVGDQFLTDVGGRDSRWLAYFAGLMNTLRVTIFGIVLSLSLGLVIGIARLSPVCHRYTPPAAERHAWAGLLAPGSPLSRRLPVPCGTVACSGIAPRSQLRGQPGHWTPFPLRPARTGNP